MEIKLNKNGVNNKIKVNILSDDKMKDIGFSENREGFWYYCKSLGSEITFNLIINKADILDFQIDILDEDYMQPYDYQEMLELAPKDKFTNNIKYKVENIMEYLKDNKIIIGHIRGEYI